MTQKEIGELKLKGAKEQLEKTIIHKFTCIRDNAGYSYGEGQADLCKKLGNINKYIDDIEMLYSEIVKINLEIKG